MADSIYPAQELKRIADALESIAKSLVEMNKPGGDA